MFDDMSQKSKQKHKIYLNTMEKEDSSYPPTESTTVIQNTAIYLQNMSNNTNVNFILSEHTKIKVLI